MPQQMLHGWNLTKGFYKHFWKRHNAKHFSTQWLPSFVITAHQRQSKLRRRCSGQRKVIPALLWRISTSSLQGRLLMANASETSFTSNLQVKIFQQSTKWTNRATAQNIYIVCREILYWQALLDQFWQIAAEQKLDQRSLWKRLGFFNFKTRLFGRRDQIIFLWHLAKNSGNGNQIDHWLHAVQPLVKGENIQLYIVAKHLGLFELKINNFIYDTSRNTTPPDLQKLSVTSSRKIGDNATQVWGPMEEKQMIFQFQVKNFRSKLSDSTS